VIWHDADIFQFYVGKSDLMHESTTAKH